MAYPSLSVAPRLTEKVSPPSIESKKSTSAVLTGATLVLATSHEITFELVRASPPLGTNNSKGPASCVTVITVSS